jgi:hypothetical protein
LRSERFKTLTKNSNSIRSTAATHFTHLSSRFLGNSARGWARKKIWQSQQRRALTYSKMRRTVETASAFFRLKESMPRPPEVLGKMHKHAQDTTIRQSPLSAIEQWQYISEEQKYHRRKRSAIDLRRMEHLKRQLESMIAHSLDG